MQEQKDELAAVITRIIDRAVIAGAVRKDLTYDDFSILTCAVMSTMYFKPGQNPDWRRHLELALTGVRARMSPEPRWLNCHAVPGAHPHHDCPRPAR